MSRRVVGGFAACLVAAAIAGEAAAVTLFSENFNGYTSFPTLTNTYFNVPAGHPVAGTVEERINSGVPRISEGATGVWYGARFQTGFTGDTNSDLAVQNYGSINRPDDPNANYTPVGRFEDEAGLVFKVSTTGFLDVHLTFGWRTFSVGTSDRVRVGYRTSNPGFGACTGEAESGCLATLTSGSGSWGNWTELALSDPGNNGNHNFWTAEDFLLPSNAAEVWVAFWLDNGEGDIGKVDNILVSSLVPIPVPAALPLLAAGMGLLGWVGRRRR